MVPEGCDRERSIPVLRETRDPAVAGSINAVGDPDHGEAKVRVVSLL
jgi:hypothetical protein